MTLPPSQTNFTPIHTRPQKPQGSENKNRLRTKQRSDHSRLLVKEEDVRAPLEERMRSRETGETAANNDDLGHSGYMQECMYVGDERRWGGGGGWRTGEDSVGDVCYKGAGGTDWGREESRDSGMTLCTVRRMRAFLSPKTVTARHSHVIVPFYLHPQQIIPRTLRSEIIFQNHDPALPQCRRCSW